MTVSRNAIGSGVRPLTPADIEQLPLRHHPRLEDGDAEFLVLQAPGLSHWHPESGEFVLVTPWRHRAEIPSVHTLTAFRHEDALIAAALDAAEAQRKAAFVLMESFESRRPSFYVRNGLDLLESIVTYELFDPAPFVATMFGRRQEFFPLAAPNGELASAVIALDHAAFPWLWRNSAEEFSAYLALPTVEIWAGLDGNDVVSYVGFTHFRGWSHLDRIAIHPHLQGRGYGREALHFAVERMVRKGARRVGLSTQGTNRRSRTMYEKIGFRETPDHNYDVYGVILPDGRRVIEER
jgi:ribosomal protein S18 acetylase RimI-like enzyme